MLKRYFTKHSFLHEMAALHANSCSVIDNDFTCDWIVFSKDRAMQLHSLLSSYLELVSNPSKITVLYKTSSMRHEQAYDELRNELSQEMFVFIKETNFRKQLISILTHISSTKIILMCDDGVVKEPFDMIDFVKYNPLVSVPTLLRGEDWHYCFARQHKQKLPEFIQGVVEPKMRAWIWSNVPESPDWSYPLSVGGHLFHRYELLSLMKRLPFWGPNSLEGNLQIYKPFFINRMGISYQRTIIGSTPINIVNSEVESNWISGGHSSEGLLDMWERGYRIKYEDLYGLDAVDIVKHDLQFVSRDK
ncbi:MAG: hypothetical protein PHU69_06485 [Fermentimonas sp.]|nr:hypothetical protein [Fermentimonas sp.]